MHDWQTVCWQDRMTADGPRKLSQSGHTHNLAASGCKKYLVLAEFMVAKQQFSKMDPTVPGLYTRALGVCNLARDKALNKKFVSCLCTLSCLSKYDQTDHCLCNSKVPRDGSLQGSFGTQISDLFDLFIS